MSNQKERPCARCGIGRRGRVDTLCDDCRYTCSEQERAIWKAQLIRDMTEMRRLAA